ncbi:MAG TPA: tetratricopeptide repeat protein [Humisphaera sp.]|jgi:TolA-binding protein|nr:tetratricopeptide repeat protein [Humisphaera sp.]
MIWTLRDWRQALRGWCVGVSLLAAPSFAVAQTPADASQPQEVDAAAKQLLAANGLLQRGLFKLAEKEYSDFLDANPKHAQAIPARYALAVCQMRLAEHDKAIETLGPVLADAKFEQRDEALSVMGYCQLVTKHYDAAQKAFAELLSKYPQSKQAEPAASYQIQALYLDGNAKQSATAAESFLHDYPHSDKRPTALYFLTLSRKSLGENEKVIEASAQLVHDFPESPYKIDALLLNGQSNEALGKLDAAIEQYRQMLAAAPEARKADAHYSLGVALYKAGQYAPAARELSAVVNDSANSPYAKPARLHLGLALLADSHTAEARQNLEQVVRDDPPRANDARYGLAQCDITDKKYEAAHQTLDDLARAQPAPANLPQILMDGAVCLMEMGKYQEACDELAAFRKQPRNPAQTAEAIYRQAFCLHKLSRFDQSHALCDDLAKLPKSDMSTPAAELDAENLFLLAKYPQARQAFDALAVNTKDEHKQLLFKLRAGQCEYFAGDYAKAADLLRPLAQDNRAAAAADLQPAIFLCGDALLQQNMLAPAAEMLARFIAVTSGDKREAQFKLARAQLGADQKEAARQTLTALVEGPADSPWVQRGLLEYGQLLYKAGDLDRGGSYLNRLAQGNPPQELAAPATYLLGWIDFDSKRYTDAADKWKTLSDKYPKHPLTADGAFQRGVALKEAGKLDDALNALQGFAGEHPESANAPKARQLAAAVLSAQGKPQEAAKLLAELAKDSKATDTVVYDLAWSQRNAKDLPTAKETYRKFLAQFAGSKLVPAVRTELAELLYDDKNYAEATDLLEKVVADNSAEPKVLGPATYRLAFCYTKQSKWENAAARFNDFADHFTDDPKLVASALLQSALASAEQNHFDQAEKSLSRMLEKYRDSDQAPIALLKLGEAQAEQQEFEPSLKSYREFLDRFSKNEFAYRARFGEAWALENLHKYEDARDSYKKVIAATNGETAARAQFQIGETYLAEQKFEPAIPALLAVEDVYAYPKWGARALLEAGRAFEQLRQPDRAKQQYTQLLAKYKTAPEASMAQERMKAL